MSHGEDYEMMREEVFRYGESNRGFGMVTLPEKIEGAPVVVLFNAGLTYREGPYRLNVLVAREFAESGYVAIRVDLSGKGDTPAREGLTNRESVTKDWEFIYERINAKFPESKLILMGLCSGADNAIKIAASKRTIHGLVLLDPVVPQDDGFFLREIRRNVLIPYNWLRSPKVLYRFIKEVIRRRQDIAQKQINLRDLPEESETVQCFENLVQLEGRALTIFTNSATRYYNIAGQLSRSLNIEGLEVRCEEEFWPWMLHMYVAQLHRDTLVKRVRQWADQHRKEFGI
jgi:pimeloyl-ACP methyl ester carboxylesterase